MIPGLRLVRLSTREIMANRTRTWLLVVCVAVAVAAMNVVTQMGASAERSIADDILRTQGQAGTYAVTVVGASIDAALSATDPASIEGATGRFLELSGAALSQSAEAQDSSTRPLALPMFGVDPSVIESMPNLLSQGRWLEPSDAEAGVVPIVLAPEVAVRMAQASGSEGLVGSVLRLNYPRPIYFTVVGVLEDGPLSRSASGFGAFIPLHRNEVPLVLADWVRSLETQPDELRLYVSSTNDSDLVARQALVFVRQTLASAGVNGVETSMLRVDTAQDFDGSTRVLALVFRGIGLVVLVIGVTAVGAVSASTLRERSSELALRRAMGASPRSLGALVLAESLIVILAGAIVGLALVVGVTSALTAWVITDTQATDFVTINASTAVTSLLATATLGVLVALLPARQAARQNVMDVLSS